MPRAPVAVLASPTLDLERAAWVAGDLVVGIDEVGRGPLAGPVVACAVVLPAGCAPLEGVRDSKTLDAAGRERAAGLVRATALRVALGAASVREIDRLNIRVATALAMRRALRRVLDADGRVQGASPRVVIDGLPMAELAHPHDALVKGDARCLSIAAAAVVAKVVRDRLMTGLAARHPAFGWERNAGYGTATHRAALAEVGATAHHRRSFAPLSQMEMDFAGGDA